MGIWTVLTIPTRIPRDPRDIPPLPEMPAYAWTVLSLTLAQVCGWCRGLGLELVCTHETKWTYTYTTKHKTPTKIKHTKTTGCLPVGLRDGGHAPRHRRALPHAPRCVKQHAHHPTHHGKKHASTLKTPLTPHSTTNNHSVDQGPVLAERGLAHRHAASAVLAHAPRGLGPLTPPPRPADASGGGFSSVLLVVCV